MSFPGPNQPPSNGGGNKPNGGNNPFTNPFSRNNDGKNGGSGANGNKSNGPRPFWQSPWLWVVVVALLAVTMFQLFAGAGSQTIDTKDGMQILNGNTVEYATIVDNTQQVKLKLSSDYSATDPDTGRTKNYGKNVQFYYTFAQGAQVAKAVENGDLEKGWTSNIEQTSVMSYLITSILPFIIFFAFAFTDLHRAQDPNKFFGRALFHNARALQQVDERCRGAVENGHFFSRDVDVEIVQPQPGAG
mgnify:CR=1 FL=1